VQGAVVAPAHDHVARDVHEEGGRQRVERLVEQPRSTFAVEEGLQQQARVAERLGPLEPANQVVEPGLGCRVARGTQAADDALQTRRGPG
jgi:hypothetical protein